LRARRERERGAQLVTRTMENEEGERQTEKEGESPSLSSCFCEEKCGEPLSRGRRQWFFRLSEPEKGREREWRGRVRREREREDCTEVVAL